MSEPLMKNKYIGLQTTYHTPHICGNCLEYIGEDWTYCPKCGTPTGLTIKDYRLTQCLLNRQDKGSD